MIFNSDMVSVIAALTAPLTVLATAFTACWNRYHDTRQTQLALYEARRLDATNAFAESFSKLYKASANYDASVRAALAATYMVIPYYDEPARQKLQGLASLLRAGVQREEIYAAFEECLSFFSASTK